MGKRIKGIAIAPGVSRNGRLYTRENLAKAFTRLSARVAEGTMPVVMRTHHDAGDDSLRIVARVVGVNLTNDGAIAYEAVPADTAAGRDIVTLADGQDKALAHVSIYGSWVGEMRKVNHGGRMVETADDLEIDKIDFTASPGVVSASARTESFEPSTDPAVISESMRPVMFADDNVGESLPSIVSVNVCGCAGGFDLSVNAWSIPAEDLDAYADTAQRALAAALAICQGGPVDDDGDAAGENTDDEMETAASAATATESGKEPTVADNNTEKPVEQVTETSTTSGDTEPTIGDVLGAIKQLTEALRPAAATEAGTTSETTTDSTEAVTETAATDNTAPVDMAALRESVKTEIIADLVAAGAVKAQRKGYRVGETATEAADPEADWKNRGNDFAKAFGLIPEDDTAAADA